MQIRVNICIPYTRIHTYANKHTRIQMYACTNARTHSPITYNNYSHTQTRTHMYTRETCGEFKHSISKLRNTDVAIVIKHWTRHFTLNMALVYSQILVEFIQMSRVAATH
ncbi:hypothetical protein NP493_394g02045 [Ridgeia piscesae]|uniref:Uncharacterized protein n=1 Tax=Ridgeia piscesae TaxID=27915 RepID=A0AAD9NUV2_RIDPI|nr:hypothetical protein NP493_394g02045 [Ridgeia piscesae]